ncbi:MAG: YtxH domain-containing protein [Chloroflexi bacterium]|jgi:gas vesicle protein|nr:YtxH domain-containing protein [Chloroflexota bacterium]
MSRFSKFIMGAFWGAAVGSIIALLYAPKSGEELRKELQEKTDEIITEVQKAADQRQQELEKEVKAPKA